MLSPTCPARLLAVALALAAAAPAAATDIDLGQSRIETILDHVRNRDLDALWGDQDGFQARELGDAIRLQAGTAAVVRMATLGEGNPLEARLSPEDRAYLQNGLPFLLTLSDRLDAGLGARAREALLDRGTLAVQKALVGTINLALRLARESEGPGEQADLVFVAVGVAQVAMNEVLLDGLLARSTDPELDEAARVAAEHLYVLHHRTRARLEVARRRFDAAR